MMTDLFDNGTPKYQSATEIYEAVQEMASGEEIGTMVRTKIIKVRKEATV